MKDRGPTPEVPADGMDASTPQGDWSFEEVEKVARLLYAQAPFDVKDTKCWEALVRQAFNFLDNLGQAYEETETWRGEMRAVADIVEEGHAAAAHLPDIVPFEKAVRFITGEKHTKRARAKFEKVFLYKARWTDALKRVHPNDPAWRDAVKTGLLLKVPRKKERRIKTQLKMWQRSGIPRQLMARQELFRFEWPLAKAQQNRANVGKRRKRIDKRRGAKPPESVMLRASQQKVI